ncbi:MAG: hypothetical protein CVU84_10485 [Firmicutes bacterium HGW-Firmicutes-1]|nr:MAG: hypothetical protein CVU84_10485 [Firmicutes bacterium HGW-Firmicutes-1]
MDQKKDRNNSNVNKDNKGGDKVNPTTDTYTTKPKVRDTEYSREISEIPDEYNYDKDDENSDF